MTAKDIPAGSSNLSEAKRHLLQKRLQQARMQSASPVAPTPQSIFPRPHKDVAPLSYGQQRLWFIHQLQPDSPLYHIPLALRLSGSLNLPALQLALQEIIRRHEVLRTRFALDDSLPVQLISPPDEAARLLPLQLIDLSTLPPAERDAQAHQLTRQQAVHPFDLSTGPLVRATLLRLTDAEHVLLWTMHHIVSDGWSLAILVREVATLYRAYSEGQASPLIPLPIQYADYAVWQREWLTEAVLAEQLSYWRHRLGRSDGAVLELPTDRARPAIQTHRGAGHRLTLTKELTAELHRLSQREGVTLFMTLLAAFQTLLYRYTGEEAISVGTPIANRTRREVEGLIGFFLNTLVMRTEIRGDISFKELLGRVREVCLGAYAHQDVPFEKLVEELQPRRDMSRSPFFQVMFVLQNAPQEELRLPGLEVREQSLEMETTKLDLTINLTERTDGLSGWIEYNSDLFDPHTISRLASHFRSLLLAVTADPAQKLARLPLLTHDEQHRLLHDFNPSATAFPTHRLVHQLVEHRAARQPHSLALAAAGQHFSYREMNERANQLARYLRRLGVTGETPPVAICLERRPEMVIAWLAVWKAGGVYVALEAATPARRLAQMVSDSGAGVVLTEGRMREQMAGLAAHIVSVDEERATIERESTENLSQMASGGTATGDAVTHVDAGLAIHQTDDMADDMADDIADDAADDAIDRSSTRSPDDLAYIIYTSGSTGQPKGVEVSHRSLLNLLCWHLDTYRLSPADRLSQIAGAGFDAALWEVWPTLVSGASLHFVDDERRAAPVQLRDWLVRERITVSFLPTPLAERVVALEWPAGGGLRYLLTGGDRLRGWARAGVGYELINHYGPTETTVVATSSRVRVREEAMGKGDAGGSGGGSGDSGKRWPGIGRAVSNTRVYILDRYGEMVGVGVRGEIYIGGVGVARGYHGMAGETAERFVPDVYGGERGGRMYRSGDMGRWGEDGEVEYEGREDGQVKVRGQRIEVGEVEAALKEAEGVAQAVVLATGGETGQRDRQGTGRGTHEGEGQEQGAGEETRLVAYIVMAGSGEGSDKESVERSSERSSEGGSEGSGEGDGDGSAEGDEEADERVREWRGWLRARLPEAMLPAGYVVLREMPVTANGKVDMEALRALAATGSVRGEGVRGGDYEAPETAVEEVVAGIWREVLKVGRVGRRDNFFDLGGHSLVATQVVSRLREVFGVEMRLRELFTGGTVEEVGRALERGEKRAGRTRKIAEMMKRIERMSEAEVSAAVRLKERARAGEGDTVKEQAQDGNGL